MPVLGISVEHEAEAVLFFEDVKKKLSKDDLIRNPFTGSVVQVERGFYVLDLKPIYPATIPVVIGVLLLMPALLFSLGWWAWLPGGALVFLGLLWTRPFFYLIMLLGLRKAGYKGKVRLLRDAETIRGVLDRWDR